MKIVFNKCLYCGKAIPKGKECYFDSIHLICENCCDSVSDLDLSKKLNAELGNDQAEGDPTFVDGKQGYKDNNEVSNMYNTSLFEDLSELTKKFKTTDSKNNLKISEESTNYEETSVWIGYVRILAWLIFAFIALAGLIMGATFMNQNALMGLVIIIGGGVLAFSTVAGLMIFLDLARDVSEIKRLLRTKNKNK